MISLPAPSPSPSPTPTPTPSPTSTPTPTPIPTPTPTPSPDPDPDQARDEANQRWHELLGTSPASGHSAQHATAHTAAAAEHIAMLRGRSETVWSEAESWAAAELSRLRQTYPEHFASSEMPEAA